MLTSVWFVCVATTFYTKVCILSYFILGVALQIITYHLPLTQGGLCAHLTASTVVGQDMQAVDNSMSL